MATPLSVVNAGGNVAFEIATGKICVCRSKTLGLRLKNISLRLYGVHIGGHISFDIEKIASCTRKIKYG